METNRSLKPDDPNREHVGFNIANSGSYNIKKICAPIHLHAPDLFIEVDTIETKLSKKFIESFSLHFGASFSTRMIIGVFALKSNDS